MTFGRPRTSTLVLSLLFLGVLALYIWVRPTTPETTGSSGPAGTPTHAQTTSAPRSRVSSASGTPSSTPSHSTTPSPALSGTGPGSPTPTATGPAVGGSGPSAASP